MTTTAERFAGNSEIVPIVHIASAGPVRYDGDRAQMPWPKQDDTSDFTRVTSAQNNGHGSTHDSPWCGWVMSDTDSQIAKSEFANANANADADTTTIDPAPNQPVAAAPIGLVGTLAAARWMPFVQPLRQWAAPSIDRRLDSLRSIIAPLAASITSPDQDASLANAATAPQTFLSPLEIAKQTAGQIVEQADAPESPSRPSSKALVGGSAFVFSIAEEYCAYDLAKSDLQQSFLSPAFLAPSVVADLGLEDLRRGDSILGQSPLPTKRAIIQDVAEFAVTKSPDWTPIAVEFMPFDLQRDLVAAASKTIQNAVQNSVQDSVRDVQQQRAEQIEHIELQLALILDEAASQMAMQRRADRVLSETVAWARHQWKQLATDHPLADHPLAKRLWGDGGIGQSLFADGLLGNAIQEIASRVRTANLR